MNKYGCGYCKWKKQRLGTNEEQAYNIFVVWYCGKYDNFRGGMNMSGSGRLPYELTVHTHEGKICRYWRMRKNKLRNNGTIT